MLKIDQTSVSLETNCTPTHTLGYKKNLFLFLFLFCLLFLAGFVKLAHLTPSPLAPASTAPMSTPLEPMSPSLSPKFTDPSMMEKLRSESEEKRFDLNACTANPVSFDGALNLRRKCSLE